MHDQPSLPNCRPTGLGSTPQTDAGVAVDFVLETFPHVPFWPQLPRRAFRENMYAQYTEHLPGACIEDERIFIQLGDGWLEKAETFYAAFLEEDPARFALSPEYGAGLYETLRRGPLEEAWAIKGQVTGPISFGLQVTDQHLRPSLYDDMMHDVIVKNVLRRVLKRLPTVIYEGQDEQERRSLVRALDDAASLMDEIKHEIVKVGGR